jgi:hypothetical protein
MNHLETEPILNSCRQLLDRLERISADSAWAHQASGVRAALAKELSNPEKDHQSLESLILLGYSILEKAAAEIPDHS